VKSVLATLLTAAVLLVLPASAAEFGCAGAHEPIDQKGFVTINGLEQWVTVKGDDCANPLVLFIHGGPGNPLSPYSDTIYGPWRKQFTVVQYDQRGAGMTYGKNPPAEDRPLTIAQLRDDGNAVAAWLAERYGKKKVILWGSSWGSILAVHMAKARPDLFYAYVGTAQVVSYRDNQAATYQYLLGLTKEQGDRAGQEVLHSVGAPPWSDPRSFGKVRKIIRRQEAAATTAPPAPWWQAAPLYTSAKAQADYEAGEDYSFLNFVGLHGDGMFSQVDLPKLGTDFAIPMFFVHGEHDMLSRPEIAKRYVASLRAPAKSIVMVAKAGHDPNGPIVAAEYKVLVEQVLPLTK
jgi:pimeloyl-ACP methyl ester carboxylesterase